MKSLMYWADVAIALAVAIFLFTHIRSSVQSMIGLSVASLGAVLWVTARLQLGASFSIEPKARKLVTHGLYSRFRHPVYVFGEVTFIGMAIAWGHWIGFVWIMLVWAIQMWRMKREDAILERAFGEEFRRYRKKTWF